MPKVQDRSDLLNNVWVDVAVELGRKDMMVSEVANLKEQEVIELDKLAGEAFEIRINGRLFARGGSRCCFRPNGRAHYELSDKSRYGKSKWGRLTTTPLEAPIFLSRDDSSATLSLSEPARLPLQSCKRIRLDAAHRHVALRHPTALQCG